MSIERFLGRFPFNGNIGQEQAASALPRPKPGCEHIWPGSADLPNEIDFTFTQLLAIRLTAYGLQLSLLGRDAPVIGVEIAPFRAN